MTIIVDSKVKHLLILLLTSLTSWQHLKGDVHLCFVRNEHWLFLLEMDKKCIFQLVLSPVRGMLTVRSSRVNC